MELQKNWRFFHVNNDPTGNDAVDVKKLFLSIKDALVKAGIRVVASCNGLATADGDILMSPSDIVTPAKDGSGPRSWVVFSFGGDYQLCVEFGDFAYNRASFVASGYDFKDGTIDGRPVAQGEVLVNRVPTWVSARGGNGGAYGAAAMVSDTSWRVIVASHKEDGEVVWLFDDVEGSLFASVYSGALSVGELITPSGSEHAYVIHEVAGNVVLPEQHHVNEISGETMLFPVGIFASGKRVGYVQDLWATASPPAKTWDRIDNLVVVGGNVFPWDYA